MGSRLKFVAVAIAIGFCGSAAEGAHAVWTERAPLPEARAEVGVAALEGKVYVVGGTEQKDGAPPKWNSQLNQAYDPTTDSWTTKAPLPHGLTHVGLAALDGKLYAIGGFETVVHMRPQPLAYVYDPAADRWSQLPSLAIARGSIAVAAVDGKLHVFGGRKADRVVKISRPGAPEMFAAFGTVRLHEIYDLATKKWAVASPIPGPARDHMGIAVLDGKIHLFGGRVEDVGDNLDRHDVYDVKTGKWSSAARLPRPRSAGAYTVLNGRIVYAGGECKPGGAPSTPNAFEDVTAYDPASDSWTTLAPLPSARHAFGAATVADKAYFVGGAPVCGAGAITEVVALTLPN